MMFSARTKDCLRIENVKKKDRVLFEEELNEPYIPGVIQYEHD
jgi:hypothetical protein